MFALLATPPRMCRSARVRGSGRQRFEGDVQLAQRPQQEPVISRSVSGRGPGLRIVERRFGEVGQDVVVWLFPPLLLAAETPSAVARISFHQSCRSAPAKRS
jgi:hypothetical protein